MEKYEVVMQINGDKAWFLNGKLHRLDGPAIEYANGNRSWYQNGKLHRLDGPAREFASGTKFWYQEGKLHRLDGPAEEHTNGDKYWYIKDVNYTEKEFISMTTNKPKLTISEVMTLRSCSVANVINKF